MTEKHTGHFWKNVVFGNTLRGQI